MEYRIKQIGPWFYPQYKKYFLWWNFKTLKLNRHGKMELLPDCKLSLERAKTVIENDKKPIVEIIHELQ